MLPRGGRLMVRYQPVRSLPVAVTRPPGYEEAVTSGRTTSVGDELHPT